jgi:uncharacterized membrane protein (DUF106 family)
MEVKQLVAAISSLNQMGFFLGLLVVGVVVGVVSGITRAVLFLA